MKPQQAATAVLQETDLTGSSYSPEIILAPAV